MAKIVFGEKKIENLEGEEMRDGRDKPLYLSQIMSNMLLEGEGKDYLKRFEMAQKLYKFEPFDVDTSDFSMLEKAIDDSKMGTIVKAQVKLELLQMKEKKEEKSKK